MINFPIIQQLKISDYQLFPGKNQSGGLNHTFQKGVNIILGINGLGKTTLLNVILRLLTGPNDINIAKPLGRGQRKVRRIPRNYFSNRVPDGAKNAIAECKLEIGGKSLIIQRSLSTFYLTRLIFNKKEISIKTPIELEEKYQELISELTGTSSFFDFLTILHYSIFFLEDRGSSFWDEETQFELLRIFFYKPASQQNYLDLFNEISKDTSKYRNINYSLNALKDMMAENARKRPSVTSNLKDLHTQQESLSQALSEEIEIYNRLDKEMKSNRNALETARYEVDELEKKINEEIEPYYASFFPHLNERASLLISSAATGKGCLVCGSQEKENLNNIVKNIEKQTCPLCKSDIEQMEPMPRKDGNIRDRFLKNVSNLEKTQQRATDFTLKLNEYQREFYDSHSSLSNLRDQLLNVEQGIEAFEKRLKKDQPDKEKKLLDEQELAIKKLDNKIKAETKKLKGLIKIQNLRINKKSQQIALEFKKIIKSLMAEKCDLKYDFTARPIGQSGEYLSFPKFGVALSSGPFQKLATERNFAQDVSESQREFIELAFRLALLKVVSGKEPAQVMLETPESSLDFYFMELAGRQLKEITKSNISVLATSNLSRERLVPSMLGIPNPKTPEYKNFSKFVSIKERERRLLDLTEIASPTAALEEHREEYEIRKKELIFPDRKN